ncbi:activity-regulated cytoskeleton associated protein 2-like [Calliphora vicina]|uniref:activity-regulated cytoskeleton associated protein 2-like n=1 Tax=Calliphora vicina TaxID=7373 RepID=UPI00325B29D6
MVLTDVQFRELLGGPAMRQDVKSTFSNCTARFNGGRNSKKIEDFLATILVYKEAENISDSYALTSLPLILEGYASTWWQGVKHEAKTFEDAIELLRKAFAPPKPDWRIFNEIFQEKQKIFESTDSFVCRKRRLFAQLSEKLSEKAMLNMIFGQLNIQLREKISRDSVSNFQEFLNKAREVEQIVSENKQERVEKGNLLKIRKSQF